MTEARLTLTDYWMGREVKYSRELTYDIIANAKVLLERVNTLLGRFADETGIEIERVASGWRPKGINDATANAAATSRHLTGEGIDLRDTANRDLARWCLANLDALELIGLWMEDPQWTPTWVHLQSRPPKSERRVYVPSTKPPLAAKLREQGGVA
jgi:hypothetical protein